MNKKAVPDPKDPPYRWKIVCVDEDLMLEGNDLFLLRKLARASVDLKGNLKKDCHFVVYEDGKLMNDLQLVVSPSQGLKNFQRGRKPRRT